MLDVRFLKLEAIHTARCFAVRVCMNSDTLMAVAAVSRTPNSFCRGWNTPYFLFSTCTVNFCTTRWIAIEILGRNSAYQPFAIRYIHPATEKHRTKPVWRIHTFDVRCKTARVTMINQTAPDFSYDVYHRAVCHPHARCTILNIEHVHRASSVWRQLNTESEGGMTAFQ